MRDQLGSEPVEWAQSKVDAQRNKLAELAADDPKRADEERILAVLINNAQLATIAHALSEETSDGSHVNA